MKPRQSMGIRAGLRLGLATAACMVAATAGCEDPFAPELRPVPSEPLPTSLVDFRTGSLTEASAFDVHNARQVRTEIESGWDFVFYVTSGGEPQFRPRGMVLEEESDAGLQAATGPFETLETAPSEGYVTDLAVPVDSGAVYVLRSRRSTDFRRCHRYGKIRVTSVDPAAGVVRFVHLMNPNCDRRGLVPGETG